MIDTIKGTITYLTAAIALLGAMAIGAWAWAQPVPSDPAQSHDIAVLFGFIGLIVGSVLSFLFGSEASTRTARATERAHEAGVYAGLATPASGTGAPDAFEHEFTGDPEDGDIHAEANPTSPGMFTSTTVTSTPRDDT